MIQPRKSRATLFVAAIAVPLAVLPALVGPGSAHAQGFFDLLFGIFRGAPREYEPPVRAYNREIPARRVVRPFPNIRNEEHSNGRPGGSSVAYCVRTCDGRYFPLPASTRGDNATPANLCSAMCPATEIRIYTGSSIDDAVAKDGKPYKDLKNAFLYRDKLVADCTCNGRDTLGTARLEPTEDPTLRPGDIIVTADGPLVFKGSRGAKRTASDFIAAGGDRSLPKSVRATLSEMRIAPVSPAATAKSEPVTVDRPALATTPGGESTMQGAQNPQQN